MRKVGSALWFIRCNLQCRVGAAVGLVALFLPWLILEPRFYRLPWLPYVEYNRLLEGSDISLFGVLGYVEGPAKVFCLVLAAGVLLAFFTTLGGLLQSAGLVGFAIVHATGSGEYSVATYERVISVSGDAGYLYLPWAATLGVGYLLAVASTFIVLTSTTAAVRAARTGPMVHNRVAALAWNTSRTR